MQSSHPTECICRCTVAYTHMQSSHPTECICRCTVAYTHMQSSHPTECICRCTVANTHMQSSHPTECICRCTVAYTGWHLEYSAGKCYNKDSVTKKRRKKIHLLHVCCGCLLLRTKEEKKIQNHMLHVCCGCLLLRTKEEKKIQNHMLHVCCGCLLLRTKEEKKIQNHMLHVCCGCLLLRTKEERFIRRLFVVYAWFSGPATKQGQKQSTKDRNHRGDSPSTCQRLCWSATGSHPHSMTTRPVASHRVLTATSLPTTQALSHTPTLSCHTAQV